MLTVRERERNINQQRTTINLPFFSGFGELLLKYMNYAWTYFGKIFIETKLLISRNGRHQPRVDSGAILFFFYLFFAPFTEKVTVPKWMCDESTPQKMKCMLWTGINLYVYALSAHFLYGGTVLSTKRCHRRRHVFRERNENVNLFAQTKIDR